MNTTVKRILTFVVSLILIVYVGYQAYRALYNPLKTTRVTSGTYEDIIRTDGFVVRSETVLTSSQSGVLDYIREDGESVSKNGEVAAIYSSEKDARNQRKIKELDKEIQSYTHAGNSESVEFVDVNALDSEIKKKFLELSGAADSADVRTAVERKNELLSLLNKKQLVTGDVTDFNAQIEKLKKQRDQLASSTGPKIGSITSPAAGYFVSSVDGFENMYSFDKILSITAKEVKNLLAANPKKPADAVGKVITGYDTYIACVIDADAAYSFHVGDNLKLRFLMSSQGNIPVTVSAINKDSSGVAMVLKCNTMSSQLAVIRRQAVEIIAGTFTGIKVSDQFIHIVNGVKGVYVRKGNKVVFKKLDSIFSSSGYTVSAIKDDSDYLQIYDEVIENGDDIYDGKVIK